MSDIRGNLEARLARPDPGENGFTTDRPPGRLDALRELVGLVASGDISIEARRGGINTHVHTSKSFSFFESPSQAVWQALLAGIEVAQRAGFTVAEIKRLFFGFPADARPSVRWAEMARDKLTELDRLIRRTREMKRLVEEGLRCGCGSLAECALLDGGEG